MSEEKQTDNTINEEENEQVDEIIDEDFEKTYFSELDDIFVFGMYGLMW